MICWRLGKTRYVVVPFLLIMRGSSVGKLMFVAEGLRSPIRNTGYLVFNVPSEHHAVAYLDPQNSDFPPDHCAVQVP